MSVLMMASEETAVSRKTVYVEYGPRYDYKFVRYCDSCAAWWLSSVSNDGNDGRPANERCPECKEQRCQECNGLQDTDDPPVCYTCRQANERQAADDLYWSEFNRNSVVACTNNPGEAFPLEHSQLGSERHVDRQDCGTVDCETHVAVPDLEEAERIRNATRAA